MEDKTLHLIILEDNPDDAAIMVKELEREGFTVEWSIVDTKKAFRKALADKPDLLLVDYRVPSFNGMTALQMQQQVAPEIPLIIVSGVIGEEVAVECMKSGATDYVLKDRLFRLGFVVKRALDEAEEHRKRKQAEEKLAYMATHDQLTDLPNRTLFNDRLTLELAHARRNRNKLAVMLLDLDRFKDVNDTLGHKAGDLLLQNVGNRLTGLLRESDTVARMGGDEFFSCYRK